MRRCRSPRQLHHHPRGVRRLAGRCDPSGNAVNALPPADQLDREGLEEAEKALANFFDAAPPMPRRARPGVLEALADDLNTPKAIPRCMRLRNAAGARRWRDAGFLRLPSRGFREWREARAPAPALPVEEIDRRIAARLSARKARNFAEADRIRDELAALAWC
jgi:cysteinyl-tRNA synthetase